MTEFVSHINYWICAPWNLHFVLQHSRGEGAIRVSCQRQWAYNFNLSVGAI